MLSKVFFYKLLVQWFHLILIAHVVQGILYRAQPKITTTYGHLAIIAAEHKNITLQTQGLGRVHVNGIDLTKTTEIAQSALQAMNKYKIDFDTSFRKIANFEAVFEAGGKWSPNTSGNVSTDINPALERSIRRFGRRLNALRRRVLNMESLLNTDDCASNPCKNGGTCQDLYNSFFCICPPAWEGSTCSKDANECAAFAGTDLGCQNGATCINTNGSYECSCAHGWFGLHCTRRSTDCTSASNVELCGHGSCINENSVAGYKCLCDQGWTTDGRSPACNTDVDECRTNKPPCSVDPPVECTNVPGSYICGRCPLGYSGNGHYCVDLDECSQDNGHCSTNPKVQCINTPGSRVCGNCPPGYLGNGEVCSYQTGGVCRINNGGCHHLATCQINPRLSSTLVECTCPFGYSGPGIGPYGCIGPTLPLSGCSSSPCSTGICRPDNSTEGYKCLCPARFEGPRCRQFRNICAESNPCQNGGSCVSLFGTIVRCVCTENFQGRMCEQEKQDCSGQLRGENGTLVFPSSGLSSATYSHGSSCAWVIETNITKVLNITFKRFNVENSTSCRYDWLQIHDGRNTLARSLGRFCGNQLPNGGSLLSTHNILYLWFRSDDSLGGSGFELTWTSTDPVCGEELKEITSHGVINSPGSPGNYPNNRDCYWSLIAPLNKRILFHFFALQLGTNPDCNHDYLEFKSGIADNGPLLAKFCNSTNPAPLTSTSPEVLIHFHSDAEDNYPGFQITYAIAEGIPGCGGIFTTDPGEIRSPSINGKYPPNVFCEYKIQLPENERIKITFLSFNVEESDGGCQFDSLAIHAGSDTEAPLVGRYCGSTLPPTYISETNELLVVFKSDWATDGEGFLLKYESVCGGIFTSRQGIIQSPGYPNDYPSLKNCIYEIVQPLGHIIELRVMDLEVEPNQFPQCNVDFLEVRDGDNENSTLVGRFCRKAPPLIISSHNYLWITFHSDELDTGKGFQANYTSTRVGCGGILKEKTGVITTPNEINNYSADLKCTWILSAPPGNIIQIVWTNFHVEQGFDCSYDYVEIFDNHTEAGMGGFMGRFCGHNNPPTMLSTSNIVTIVFQSDSSVNLEGFTATYTFQPQKNVCGGNYLSPAGSLQSPGYPGNYPENTECFWTITVAPNNQIMLNFTDFEVEVYPGCKYDSLTIRNGGSTTSPILGTYCGTTIPTIIPSQTNKLSISFKSDTTKSYRGFRLTWSATATGCGGSLTGPTGSIISPNYPESYNSNAECIWKISVSAGSTVQLVFSDLDLEANVACGLDYVQIFDGVALNSKVLGRFCTSTSSPVIKSSSNHVLVKFRSDISQQGRGFQLQYSTVCNNTVTGFSGVIESPNFPNPYPVNLNCNWEIKVPSHNKINISFSHLELEKFSNPRLPVNINWPSRPDCIFDYVEVLYLEHFDQYHEAGPFQKYGRYCDDQIPGLITLNSDHAKILFATDGAMDGAGFRLEWSLEGCGGILTAPQGTIMSPNYPLNYPPSIQCEWTITVDYGKSINITFHEMEIEKENLCLYDYVKVFNGEDDTYPEITTLCHLNKPALVASSGNAMFIKFKADPSFQGKGFVANYSTQDTKCGGHYTAYRGTIMSPNYPNVYDIGDTCQYLIQIEEGHVIELHFEDFNLFNLFNQNNCSSNNRSFIKIHDGPSPAYPLLAKLCKRPAANKTFVSTYNEMFIEMVTDPDAGEAKGFLAKYKKACGARIETDGSGQIRISPHDVDFFTEDGSTLNCSWTIVSKTPSEHVSLTITHLDTLWAYCDDPMDTYPLTIYNGETGDAPLLGQYCGTKVPPTLTSDGAALHIVLNIDAFFFATYSVFSSACGGTLTSSDGYFSSPGYPNSYAMNADCEWLLDVPEGNRVTVSFTEMELLGQDGVCNTDYLEIREKSSSGKLLGVYCGNNNPNNITTVGSLWLYLKTSSYEGDTSTLTAKGFYAEYLLNHNNVLHGPSGVIASPKYFYGFGGTESSSWTINVDYGKHILLTIKEINIEVHMDDTCLSELVVYDGSDDTGTVLSTLCGSVPPPPLKSSSNVLYIRGRFFTSPRSTTRFRMEWQQIDNEKLIPQGPKLKSCGSSIDMHPLKNYTIIDSPGYPHGYEANLNCEWVITTVPINHLGIAFYDVDLEMNPGGVCYTDYIEIFQRKIDSFSPATAANGDWESVRKICTNNVSDPIHTTNLMKVVFKTNRFQNGTGFSARVFEACGGTLTDPTGEISYNSTAMLDLYPRVTFTFKTCQWNVTVRPGRTIDVELASLVVNNEDKSPCRDYLMLKNGILKNSPPLGIGKYCDQISTPIALSTTSNTLSIRLSNRGSTKDFVIKYKEKSFICGGQIKLNNFENSTTISSPNYPNLSPAHIECSWIIVAPPGEVLRIDLLNRFDVSDIKGEEFVEVRNGATVYSPLINKTCGAFPNSQFTTDNMMFVRYFTEVDDPGNGFKAKITIASCGGIIRDKTGQIQSPFFNMANRYPSGVECTWHLVAPTDHNMEIAFKQINFPPPDFEGANCSDVDSVTISEKVDNDNTNVLGRFCGNVILPAPIKTLTNEVTVHLKTGHQTHGFKGFSLTFNASNEACGGEIEASEGFIQSPGYPQPRKAYRRCNWLITVPKGRRVTVELLDIDIETTSGGYMNALTFYNADKFLAFITMIRKDSKERVVRSTDNVMAIYYWGKGTNRGFKLKFSSSEPTVCDGDFSDPENGVLTQPSFPNMNSYVCTYIRDKSSLPENTTLVLDVETKTNWSKSEKEWTGFIPIYGGVQLSNQDVKKVLGEVAVPAKGSIRSPFAINRLTARQQNGRYPVNFTISYRVHPCGGVIKGEIGRIQSPGYPNKYPQLIECAWLLTLPSEQSINLTFVDLALGSSCDKSYLDIYNGDSPKSPKIGRFCQNSDSYPIQSQSNHLWLEFKADRDLDSSFKGFVVAYEPVIQGCGGFFHDRSRIIQTPNYPKDYPNNGECLWVLQSDEGYHIGLTFESRFHVAESGDCSQDFVEIWDWRNEDWTSMGKICGRELPRNFNSTGHKMKILFRSDDKVTSSGFRAKWEWNCGGVFPASQGEQFIVSPGYPSNYPPNTFCQYNITVPKPGQYINVKFYDFNLERVSSSCKYDNLTISNTFTRYSLLRHVYCGATKPPDVRLMNSVYIDFKTDRYVQRTGYKFSYQLESCGGSVTEPSMISTPPLNMTPHPGLYFGFLTCVWNITAPPGKIVMLQFEKFHFPARRLCLFDNVEIYEGLKTNTANRIANLCGDLNLNPPVIKSVGNSLAIRIRTDRTVNFEGFTASVYWADGPSSGCGGDFNVSTTRDIELESPRNLPDLDCFYTIFGPVGSNLKIVFTELNLPTTGCEVMTNTSLRREACRCSYVEVKDGPSPLSETVEKICNFPASSAAGSSRGYLNQEIITSGKAATIRVYTRGLINNAFKATIIAVASPCGEINLNVTKDLQTFTSPLYPSKYPDNLRCRWLLKGTQKFVLHFVDFDLIDDNKTSSTVNTCGKEKLQIIDDQDSFEWVHRRAFGPMVQVTGLSRQQSDFSIYNTISGIHQFCGKTQKPFDFYSNRQELTVSFASGPLENNRGRGFKIEYQTLGCNRNYTADYGRIVNNLQENSCVTTITVPVNNTISLFVQYFMLYDVNTCERVGLEIRDGDSTAKTLLKSCGYALPSPIFSTTNKLWLYSWNKSAANRYANFDIIYTSSPKGRGCGGTMYDYKGRFSSPFYPTKYTDPRQCTWEIRVPIGLKVGVKFTDFDLQGECGDNYLKVLTYDENNVSAEHQFCKNDDPAPLYATGSHVTVTYQSSLQNEGRGWIAMFEAVQK